VPAKAFNLTRSYDHDARYDRTARRQADDEEGGDGTAERPRDYALEAAKRAKRRIRRVVRSRGLRHIDTFTFSSAGVADRKQAMRVWASFVHRNKGMLFGEGAYLYVLERHKSGHWHIHVCRGAYTRSPSDLRCIHTAWRTHLERAGVLGRGEFGGWWQSSRKKCSSARHSAAYVSKYLSKDLGDGLPAGSHRYEVSEGSHPVAPVVSSYGDRYTALLSSSTDLRFMRAHHDGWAAGLPYFWGIWEQPD